MLNEYIQKIKDIANKAEHVTKSNKLVSMDFSLHENITTMKMKINEIVDAINAGAIRGENGAPGKDGIDGVDGKDFKYEDFTPEQLEQLRGPQGYRGEQGIQGVQGDKGEKGDKGATGATGPAGATGPKGDKGDKGDKGLDGKNIELQRTNTHIQWRQEGQTQWINLIEIDELRAPAMLNIDAYTKEETDQLIADAITNALEQVGVMLDDYATKQYVKEQIDALYIVDSKTITNTEVRPEFISFEENPNAIDRIKLIESDGTSACVEILKKSQFKFYSNATDTESRLYWANSGNRSNVLYYKYINGQWTISNGASGTVQLRIHVLKPANDYVIESTIELNDSSNLGEMFYKKSFTKEIIADYNMATDSTYYNIDHNGAVLNAPAEVVKGYLKNEKIANSILQTVYDTKNSDVYMRFKNGTTWTSWTKNAKGSSAGFVSTSKTTDDENNVHRDFNNAIKCSVYELHQEGWILQNSPSQAVFKGIMTVDNTDSYTKQTVTDSNCKTFIRIYDKNSQTWGEWKEDAKKSDLVTVQNKIEELQKSYAEKINTYNYTNADGMIESYNWIDMNGFKVMWVNVKMSEDEYNSGSSGLIMKTLQIPATAQIFNNIIMANITSYCRESTNTLSRIVQNAEVISNVSVRGRWRHTDNTYPKIDSFTIMLFGF